MCNLVNLALSKQALDLFDSKSLEKACIKCSFAIELISWGYLEDKAHYAVNQIEKVIERVNSVDWLPVS